MAEGIATNNGLAPPTKKRKIDDIDTATDDTPIVKRNARVVEIVPEADVTLRIGTGEEAMDIKASGLILGLASKVFKTMLNSQFIEGTTEVVILDDEPGTILDFCHIVHLKYDSIVSMDAERLRNLIVFAEMRQSLEAVKPWVLYTLHDHLKWFEDLTVTKLDSDDLPTRYPGLCIEDFIPIASIFGLDDLFWQATLAYIGQSSQPIKSTGTLLERFPSISSQDGVCLHDFLNRVRVGHIQSLLKKVSREIAVGFRKVDSDGARFEPHTFCRISQEKYGAFVSWLVMQDINVWDLPAYSGSWWSAKQSVYIIAEDQGGVDADSGGLGEDWIGRCTEAGCNYCKSGLKALLRSLVDDDAENLTGVCLKCFTRNSGDSLHCRYCWELDHSDLPGEKQYHRDYLKPAELDLRCGPIRRT